MDPSAIGIEAVLWSALWQSTAWLIAGLLASTLLSRRPARAHAVLLLCILGAALTPLATAGFRLAGWGLLPGLNRSVDVADLAAQLNIGDGPPVMDPALAWPHALAAGWLVLSLVLMLHLFASARRGRRLLSGATPINSGRLVALARQAARRLDLKRSPQVLECASVHCPVIWCWGRRPRLVMPVGLPDGGTALRGVLFHELAHQKRRDHLASLAGEMVRVVLPWNPLAWLTTRRLRDLSDQACDRWAIASGESPTSYAEALLGLIPQPRVVLTLAALNERRTVARRIDRILDPRPAVPHSGLRWTALVALATALVATGAALAHRQPPTIKVVDETADLVPEDAPEVITIPYELDLDVGERGLSKSLEVLLCNRSREPRDVLGYSTSCGCMTVEWFEPRTLDTGECMRLRITMTAPLEPGALKTKYVTFYVEGQPPLELAVHLLAAGSDS